MVALSMQLIGRASIRRIDSTVVDIPPSVQPLLGYLCLEPTASRHRERVVEELWPDLPSAVGRRRLNTVVWRARSLFGGDRDEVLQVTRDGVMRLDKSRIEIDVDDAVLGIGRDVRAGAASGAAEAVMLLERAARIDASDFLVGCYEDWVVRARDELCAGVVSVLETLVSLARTTDEEIAWSELLLRRDPLREDSHRRLIRLYAEAGRRSDALHQYNVCRQRLQQDLGVEPLVETSLLAAAVRAGVPPLTATQAQPAEALLELRRALASCRNAAEQIERALAALPSD